MNLEELEAEVLKLNTHARAQLAEKLLQSLDVLSEAENERLWANEALRTGDGYRHSASCRGRLPRGQGAVDMNRRVSFHAMAEQEINDAASYYNASRPGLGQAFLDEV